MQPLALSLLFWTLCYEARLGAIIAPLGFTKNGTYLGLSMPQFNQDLFLGIPYAKPPAGEHRFRYPRSLTSKFSDLRNATQIGFTCPGKDNATLYALEKDCLNLNVIRPPMYRNNTSTSTGLPV